MFFQTFFVLLSVRRVTLNSKYRWIAEKLFPQLFGELISFRLLFGSLTDVPDYVLNYSASSAGNKVSELAKCFENVTELWVRFFFFFTFQSTQPTYHLFHCQLDARWLHITLLYQLIFYKQQFTFDTESTQSYHNDIQTFETLEKNLTFVISDLIVIAVKRFQHIDLNDLRTRPLFTCTCVRELWKLLQIFCDTLDSRRQCPVS